MKNKVKKSLFLLIGASLILSGCAKNQGKKESSSSKSEETSNGEILKYRDAVRENEKLQRLIEAHLKNDSFGHNILPNPNNEKDHDINLQILDEEDVDSYIANPDELLTSKIGIDLKKKDSGYLYLNGASSTEKEDILVAARLNNPSISYQEKGATDEVGYKPSYVQAYANKDAGYFDLRGATTLVEAIDKNGRIPDSKLVKLPFDFNTKITIGDEDINLDDYVDLDIGLPLNKNASSFAASLCEEMNKMFQDASTEPDPDFRNVRYFYEDGTTTITLGYSNLYDIRAAVIKVFESESSIATFISSRMKRYISEMSATFTISFTEEEILSVDYATEFGFRVDKIYEDYNSAKDGEESSEKSIGIFPTGGYASARWVLCDGDEAKIDAPDPSLTQYEELLPEEESHE